MALPDAPEILLQLHGSILRLLCHRSGISYDGVGSAARALRRSGHLSNGLKKKLEQLDIAAAWIRHANGPKAAKLLSDVDQCFRNNNQPCTVPAPKESDCLKCADDEPRRPRMSSRMEAHYGNEGTHTCSAMAEP